MCLKKKVNFSVHEDYVLNGVNEITNSSGNPYVKFTPFLNAAKKKKVSLPKKNTYTNYISSKKSLIGEYKKNIHKFYEKNNNIAAEGGRSNAIKIFKNIESFADYNKARDFPAIETTHLSAYLKFNVVSIRETYHFFKKELPKNTKLITQLYWRDFYMSVIYHHPHVIGNNMNNHKIKWETNKSLFDKWKKGQTGFPLIDAGMRQLNETGWMHNRTRMNVANFLVKILHIDWKLGEKYFAQNLVDYDPANNNGGWQWCASTGTDSQPYFRYFNPWAQSKKFDPDAEYIKKWIPELEDVDPKDIHKWNVSQKNYKNVKYPKPIVDNIQQKIKEMLDMYK
jgi:deoxyribodipyrimidine photo-lyase